MTNYERFRSMSVEEMAEKLDGLMNDRIKNSHIL